MTVKVSLHTKTKRRKRDSATVAVLLVCIGGVVWSGLVTFQWESEGIRSDPENETPLVHGNVRIALEHENHRRLQESYPQEGSLQAGRTTARETLFHENTRSMHWSAQRLSTPDKSQRASPPQRVSVQSPSQQQEGQWAPAQQAPLRFVPERVNEELESVSKLRIGGSHQQQEGSRVEVINSKGIDQQQQPSSDGLGLHEGEHRSQVSRRQVQSLQGGDLERPIMYTYYEKAVTDMTDDADRDLLENWKKAWFDAGWLPTILNESDARLLPEFDALVELVVDPKHIGTYNMACKSIGTFESYCEFLHY